MDAAEVGRNVQKATVFEFDKQGLLSATSKSNAAGKTDKPLIDASNGKQRRLRRTALPVGMPMGAPSAFGRPVR